MPGAKRIFYVQSWMTRATYLIAAMQLVGAGVISLLGSSIAVGPVIPTMFVVGAALTAYQARWTSRTPIAVVEQDAVVLRPAFLAKPRRLAFSDVRTFARVPPGWLVFLGRDGAETKIPLMALSPGDADALVEALRAHLTEVDRARD